MVVEFLNFFPPGYFHPKKTCRQPGVWVLVGFAKYDAERQIRTA